MQTKLTAVFWNIALVAKGIFPHKLLLLWSDRTLSNLRYLGSMALMPCTCLIYIFKHFYIVFSMPYIGVGHLHLPDMMGGLENVN